MRHLAPSDKKPTQKGNLISHPLGLRPMAEHGTCCWSCIAQAETWGCLEGWHPEGWAACPMPYGRPFHSCCTAQGSAEMDSSAATLLLAVKSLHLKSHSQRSLITKLVGIWGHWLGLEQIFQLWWSRALSYTLKILVSTNWSLPAKSYFPGFLSVRSPLPHRWCLMCYIWQ